MKTNPIPNLSWIQALDGWMPPAEWAQDYDWIDQLPRPQDRAEGLVLDPPPVRGREVTEPSWLAPQETEWTDVPDWLRALADDAEYERSRVIESPYGGWGGGAMQARRRGLR